MTDERLAELERLLAKVTPGWWSYDDGITDDRYDPPERGKPECLYVGQACAFGPYDMLPQEEMDANGKAVAAAMNAAPRLVAEVRRLRAELAAYAREKAEQAAYRREAEDRQAGFGYFSGGM